MKGNYWKGDKWVNECKNAVFAPLCGAERVCMAQNCHSDIGLLRCPVDIDQEEFFSQGDTVTTLSIAIRTDLVYAPLTDL